jgi:sRNA-binding protein
MPTPLPPALLRALEHWAARAELPPMLRRLLERQSPWPMKRGIHYDLAARHPDGDAAAVRQLLRKLGSWPTYHRAILAPDAKRHDLDGNIVGEIGDEDRAYAARELARIKAAQQDARKTRQAASELPTGSEGHAEAKGGTAAEPAPEVVETKPKLGPGGRPILSLKFGADRKVRQAG